jgi:hypothetical protein
VSGAGATPDVVLLSHPANGPGGCAGLPAGTDGEVPAAFVVLGEPAPLHEVSAYPAERAAPYKRLRALEAVARSPGRRRARPCGAGPRTQDALSASRARDRCRTKPPLGISSRESGRTVPGREGNARRYGPSGVEPAADRPRPGRRWRYCLGHEPVQRWNLPDGWVISHKPAHPPLVSETDFIAAQDINAARGPAPGIGLTAPQKRC